MLVSVRFCLRGVMRNQPLMLGLLLLLAGLSPARPQDPGTLDEKQMPPLAHPDSPSTPAKELFARKTEPLAGPARSTWVAHARESPGAGIAFMTDPNDEF